MKNDNSFGEKAERKIENAKVNNSDIRKKQ